MFLDPEEQKMDDPCPNVNTRSASAVTTPPAENADQQKHRNEDEVSSGPDNSADETPSGLLPEEPSSLTLRSMGMDLSGALSELVDIFLTWLP
ncbi:hypothetical protein VKT23_001669 [Stygiomarasmius scandens]|uniref:Uncharacterized protein n=1 Tax=Marasmiellus scandens TaxID=2682957 RepID=A0ABR1JZL1_9AGAR